MTSKHPKHPAQRFWKAIIWLGLHDRTVLLLLLVVVGGTWGFLELADDVIEGDTQALDERVLHAMRDEQGGPIGARWVEEMGRDFTALGGVAVLTIVTLGVAGFLWLDHKRGMMWSVLIAVGGGLTLSHGLKAYFARERPEIVEHLSHVYTASFPSGHSLGAAVVYLTLAALVATVVARPVLRFYVLFLAIGVTLLVGVSRVYMGVHYPSDVLAGWTAGGVWAVLCRLVVRRLQRRGQVETERSTEES